MIDRKLWHASLTDDVILAAVERYNTTLDNPGFCIVCGEEAMGVDPDARNYRCESCGADQVFGAEELVLAL
jgi:hypothetical protein